jgi:hypothetical protein
MKKISTAAAKQISNFSEQKLTIGLDLGDRSSWYCVLNEAGDAHQQGGGSLFANAAGARPKRLVPVGLRIRPRRARLLKLLATPLRIFKSTVELLCLRSCDNK